MVLGEWVSFLFLSLGVLLWSGRLGGFLLVRFFWVKGQGGDWEDSEFRDLFEFEFEEVVSAFGLEVSDFDGVDFGSFLRELVERRLTGFLVRLCCKDFGFGRGGEVTYFGVELSKLVYVPDLVLLDGVAREWEEVLCRERLGE